MIKMLVCSKKLTQLSYMDDSFYKTNIILKHINFFYSNLFCRQNVNKDELIRNLSFKIIQTELNNNVSKKQIDSFLDFCNIPINMRKNFNYKQSINNLFLDILEIQMNMFFDTNENQQRMIHEEKNKNPITEILYDNMLFYCDDIGTSFNFLINKSFHIIETLLLDLKKRYPHRMSTIQSRKILSNLSGFLGVFSLTNNGKHHFLTNVFTKIVSSDLKLNKIFFQFFKRKTTGNEKFLNNIHCDMINLYKTWPDEDNVISKFNKLINCKTNDLQPKKNVQDLNIQNEMDDIKITKDPSTELINFETVSNYFIEQDSKDRDFYFNKEKSHTNHKNSFDEEKSYTNQEGSFDEEKSYTNQEISFDEEKSYTNQESSFDEEKNEDEFNLNIISLIFFIESYIKDFKTNEVVKFIENMGNIMFKLSNVLVFDAIFFKQYVLSSLSIIMILYENFAILFNNMIIRSDFFIKLLYNNIDSIKNYRSIETCEYTQQLMYVINQSMQNIDKNSMDRFKIINALNSFATLINNQIQNMFLIIKTKQNNLPLFHNKHRIEFAFNLDSNLELMVNMLNMLMSQKNKQTKGIHRVFFYIYEKMKKEEMKFNNEEAQNNNVENENQQNDVNQNNVNQNEDETNEEDYLYNEKFMRSNLEENSDKEINTTTTSQKINTEGTTKKQIYELNQIYIDMNIVSMSKIISNIVDLNKDQIKEEIDAFEKHLNNKKQKKLLDFQPLFFEQGKQIKLDKNQQLF